MHRSLKSYVDQAAKHERELQRLVWPNGAPAPAPARSAAEKIFPHLATGRTVEIARRDTAPLQQTTPSTLAELVYPNLARRGTQW
jgi:hypothetical protein